ncbi:transposase, partial [Lacticaseibacillus rhamnosus]
MWVNAGPDDVSDCYQVDFVVTIVSGPDKVDVTARIDKNALGAAVRARGVECLALQADLVLHCGESTGGFYLATLCAIDVASGWTELQPIWGLGMQRVGTGFHHIRQRLPFPLQSLHTDNGTEFINQTLYNWCRQEKIAFTRGRAYRKNDQAYVEQRNWLTVRRQVGYDRFSSKEAYALLGQL